MMKYRETIYKEGRNYLRRHWVTILQRELGRIILIRRNKNLVNFNAVTLSKMFALARPALAGGHAVSLGNDVLRRPVFSTTHFLLTHARVPMAVESCPKTQLWLLTPNHTKWKEDGLLWSWRNPFHCPDYRSICPASLYWLTGGATETDRLKRWSPPTCCWHHW